MGAFDDDDSPDMGQGVFPVRLPEGLTPQKIMTEFKEFLKQKLEEERYEPLGPLSPKDAREWDSLNKKKDEIINKIAEVEARMKLFWSRLERKLGILDKSLKIIDHVVYVEKDPKKEQSGT